MILLFSNNVPSTKLISCSLLITWNHWSVRSYQSCGKVVINNLLLLWISEISLTCRRLEMLIPHFPIKEDIIATLANTTKAGIVKYVVQHFERLQVGERLLPSLVEFYRWLHTQLGRYHVYANRTCHPITTRNFNSRNFLYSNRTVATTCNYFLYNPFSTTVLWWGSCTCLNHMLQVKTTPSAKY